MNADPLQCVKDLPFESGKDGTFIDINKFTSYLREHQVESDTTSIRKGNIVRQISKFKDSFKIDEGIEKLSVSTVFRYMFLHMDDYQVCETFCNEVIQAATGKPSERNATPPYELLYKEIIKTALSIFQNVALSSITIKNSDLKFIEEAYEDQFSFDNWKKIQLFEFHFQTFFKLKSGISYEYILQKKNEFFGICRTAKDTATTYQRMVVKNIEINHLRKNAAEALNGIQLKVDHIYHLPDAVEKDISNTISRYLPEGSFSILCLDCTMRCNHSRGIHVMINLNRPVEDDTLNNIATFIRAVLKRKHFVNTPEIVFLKNHPFHTFQDATLPRFTTRNELKAGTLSENIHLVIRNQDDERIEPSDLIQPNLCTSCFEDFKFLNDPLDIDHFDVCKEWLMYVPLPIQIQFEHCYLNKDIIKTNNIDQLKPKIASLYCQFQSQLKIYNQSHSGIIQDIYTDELIVNYHNISTVFSLTSHSGLSYSQRTGDRRLRKNADPELCYYRTFLKEYELEYQMIGQMTNNLNKVSINSCYVALLMDNLVHLTMRVDPQPGQTRTNQLCTLPLTIKGIPKNAHTTLSWHKTTCDGSDECKCKEQPDLDKSHINHLFLDLTDAEKSTNNIFEQNMTWGFQSLFGLDCMTMLVDTCKQSQRTDAQILNKPMLAEENINESSMEELNRTLESIKLQTEEEDPEATLPIDYNGEEHLMSDQLTEDTRKVIDELNLTIDSIHLDNDDNDYDDGREADEMSDTASVDIIFDDEDSIQSQQSESEEEIEAEPYQLSCDVSEIETNGSTMSLENADLEVPNDDENEMVEHLIDALISNEADNFVIPVNERSSTELPPVLPVAEPPPLLCRHPPPAYGRDDDIMVLKKVLDDIIVKTDVDVRKDKIIFAPDYKIAKNLLKLIDSSEKYQVFLPEFPILHLRKSKITNLMSAYKTTGLLHILQYMKDEDNEKDWTKLLTIENIETATRNIWRLSVALHLSFFVCFISTLPENECQQVLQMINQNVDNIKKEYEDKFSDFVKIGCNKNATFCLHYELMKHCDEIVALAVSERIGGKNGYDLLTANVKTSLPFSFLNNASSYAGFCIRLLMAHYSSSYFHQNLKHSLYSSPHNDSKVNFGLDTSREIDHRAAKKCIRPTSTINSVLPKMSTVDDQRKIHIMRMSLLTGMDDNDSDIAPSDNKSAKSCASKYLQKHLSSNDLEHIIRTSKLILKMNALSTVDQKVPQNMYHPKKPEISETLLDKTTFQIGNYLIKRYLCINGILGLTEDDITPITDVNGPKQLLSRVKAMKSTTINRGRCQQKSDKKPDHIKEEEKRQQKVRKQTKEIEGFSSKQNACQAVVRPDCSKRSTNKSAGVKRALMSILKLCARELSINPSHTQTDDKLPVLSDLLVLNFKQVPEDIATNAVAVVVEFAGAKFKTFATTGETYMKYVSESIIAKLANQLPKLKQIVICEEKYSFTPDVFKAATRLKRQTKDPVTISHLKEKDEIISKQKFNKKAAITTGLGKRTVSNYLGTHLKELDVQVNLTVDVDSEAVYGRCSCGDQKECTCSLFTNPMRAQFTSTNVPTVQQLTHIKQRKGEAEMAQADWLKEIEPSLEDGQSIINYVTSADIDTIVIQLLTVSLFWKRNTDGSFKCPVYVWLQKEKQELYCITGILRVIEKQFQEPFIGAIIAVLLAMGGNDYIPNFHGISHEKLILAVLSDLDKFKSIIRFQKKIKDGKMSYVGTLDVDLYVQLYMKLYYPKAVEVGKLNIQEIYQLSVKIPGKSNFEPIQKWMPPESSLRQLAKLVQCQIDYFLTVFDPEADLPNFLATGILNLREDGTTIFNLGPNSRVESKEECIKIPEDELLSKLQANRIGRKKRQSHDTPQKGRRTKRQPKMSTPRKVQARRKLPEMDDE